MAITVLDNTFAKVRRIFDNTKSIAAMMTAICFYRCRYSILPKNDKIKIVGRNPLNCIKKMNVPFQGGRCPVNSGPIPLR